MGGALGIKGTLGTAEKISRSVPDFTSNRTMSGSPGETPTSSNRRPTRTQPSRHVLRPNVCLFWFPGDRQTGVGETKKVVRDDGPLSIKQWVTVNWDGEDVPGLILALGASRPAVTKILDNVDCERLPTEYTPGQKFWEGEWEAETHQERNNHNESQHTQENEPRKKRKRQPKQQPTEGEVAPSPKKAIISVGGRMIQVLAADVAGWKTAEEGDLVTATYAKRMVDGRLMKIGRSEETAQVFNLDCNDEEVPDIDAFAKKKEKESFTVVSRAPAAPRPQSTPATQPTEGTVSATTQPTEGTVNATTQPTEGTVNATTQPTEGTVNATTQPTEGTVNATTQPTEGTVNATTQPTEGTVNATTQPTEGTVNATTETTKQTVNTTTETTSNYKHTHDVHASTPPTNNNSKETPTSVHSTPPHLPPTQSPLRLNFMASSPVRRDGEEDIDKHAPASPILQNTTDLEDILFTDVMDTMNSDRLDALQHDMSEMRSKVDRLLGLEKKVDLLLSLITKTRNITTQSSNSSNLSSSSSSSWTEPSRPAASSSLPAASSSLSTASSSLSTASSSFSTASSLLAASSSLPAASPSLSTASSSLSTASSSFSTASSSLGRSNMDTYFGTDLQDLRMRCHYSQQFAQKLSKMVITPEEFLSKNCSGTKGKGAHDKEKLGRIREATQMYFHLSDKAMEVEWKQCVKQIDEWGRYLKKRGSKALQAKENMPIA
ncbi:uncharacterized protein LOC144903005 [Branchiostoma floridae x Branchiostoma belcheri]